MRPKRDFLKYIGTHNPIVIQLLYEHCMTKTRRFTTGYLRVI